MKRLIGATLVLVVLIGGIYGYRLVCGTPFAISHFADRSGLKLVVRFPELVTMIGAIDNTLLDFHSDQFSDLSPGAEREVRRFMAEVVDRLDAYPRDELRGQDLATRDYLDWAWGSRLAPFDHPYHFFNFFYAGPYPVNPTAGAQEIPLTTLSQFQRVFDEDSARRYLARLRAAPVFLQNLELAVRHRAAMGVLPPRVLLLRLIDRAQLLINLPVGEWSVYAAFERQLRDLDMSTTQREALLDSAWSHIELMVLPAYEQYLVLLESLLEEAPTDIGAWTLPDGDSYYQSLLNHYTTTTLSAEEIHELGVSRVAALSLELSEALTAIGFSGETLSAQLDAFSASSIASWPEPPDAQQVLDEYSRHLAELEADVGAVFPEAPIPPLQVLKVPLEEELGSPLAYYRPPSLDGERAGRFYVNLYDPPATQRFGMRSLAAHEGIPGHHLQISVAQAVKGIPLARNIDHIAAYSEGWALYAERLAHDLDLYDPVSNIGRLQSEMFRAVRLVVDTGIHVKRWGYSESIRYMRDHTGMPLPDVVAEVERYIAMPGQACAYMVGMLEILELREFARRSDPESFELRRFHEVVLGSGAVTLGTLRQEVEAAFP